MSRHDDARAALARLETEKAEIAARLPNRQHALMAARRAADELDREVAEMRRRLTQIDLDAAGWAQRLNQPDN